MSLHVGVRGPGHLSRVVGWTPTALGASLLGWWDAEDASTITQSGGIVSAWNDKVASYSLTQATGSSRPTYSASSFNSRPAVSFDGVDDCVELASVPFPVNANASELWLLVDQQTLAADGNIRTAFGYGAVAATARQLQRLSATGNKARAATGDGAAAQLAQNAGDFSGRCVVRAIIGATTTNCHLNGVATTDVAVVPATTAAGRVRIGANTSTTAGQFAQVGVSAALVTSSLSTADAAKLLAYLKARGGIA